MPAAKIGYCETINPNPGRLKMIEYTLGMIGIISVSCMVGLAVAVAGSGLVGVLGYFRRSL